MAFGVNQKSKATPATATWIFRIVLYVCMLGNVGISSFTSMKPETKLKIVELSSFLTLAVHSASKMFGVPLPDNAEVQVKDVDALKTDKPVPSYSAPNDTTATKA